MNKFDMTQQGYNDAYTYLKKIGEVKLIDKEQSTDGYTIIALANSLYEEGHRD